MSISTMQLYFINMLIRMWNGFPVGFYMTYAFLLRCYGANVKLRRDV